MIFCKKCGKELKDDALFCGACGEKIVIDIVKETKIETKPQATPTEYLVGKQKYLLKHAGKTTKILTFISWATALICIGLLILSYFITLNTSVTDISSAKYALDIDTVQEGYDVVMTDFIDSRNDFSLFRHWADTNFDDVVKAMDDTIDKPSVNNIKAFSEAFDEMNPAVINSIGAKKNGKSVVTSYEWLDDTFDIITPVVSVIEIVLLCFMILCAAFVLFSSAFRLNGLAITGFIFAAIYAVLFTNILFIVLISLFALASAVLLIITNFKYRSYKKNFYIPKPKKKGA